MNSYKIKRVKNKDTWLKWQVGYIKQILLLHINSDMDIVCAHKTSEVRFIYIQNIIKDRQMEHQEKCLWLIDDFHLL